MLAFSAIRSHVGGVRRSAGVYPPVRGGTNRPQYLHAGNAIRHQLYSFRVLRQRNSQRRLADRLANQAHPPPATSFLPSL